jgi:hypothetical protein
MSQFPKEPKKIRARITRYERELRKEYEMNGFIRDGYGKRYLLGPLYLLLGDLAGAIKSFEWFEEMFPRDMGEPVHSLCWTLALYRAGNIAEASHRFVQTMLSNLYLIPHLIGLEQDELDIWHGSNLAEKEYLEYIPPRSRHYGVHPLCSGPKRCMTIRKLARFVPGILRSLSSSNRSHLVRGGVNLSTKRSGSRPLGQGGSSQARPTPTAIDQAAPIDFGARNGQICLLLRNWFDLMVCQPVGHPLLEPGIFELEPCLLHLWMANQQILEATECPLPSNGIPQSLPQV